MAWVVMAAVCSQVSHKTAIYSFQSSINIPKDQRGSRELENHIILKKKKNLPKNFEP